MASDKKNSRLFFVRKTIVSPTYGNLFAYGANNPVKYTDPNGKSPVWFGIGQSGFGHEAPQRVGGYYDSYDDYASALGFDIDGTALKTEKKSDLTALGITKTTLKVINNKNGKTIGLHSEKKSFWTTLFSWFNNSHKEDITTINTITFKDEESASSFMNNLSEDVKNDAKSYKHNRQQNIDIQRDGNKIIINWGNKNNE